jgi:diadenosine tetraphosphate (Ap4A) HIT family hydrolase
LCLAESYTPKGERIVRNLAATVTLVNGRRLKLQGPFLGEQVRSGFGYAKAVTPMQHGSFRLRQAGGTPIDIAAHNVERLKRVGAEDGGAVQFEVVRVGLKATGAIECFRGRVALEGFDEGAGKQRVIPLEEIKDLEVRRHRAEPYWKLHKAAEHQGLCAICEEIHRCRGLADGSVEHPGFIAELATGYVVLYESQHCRGASRFLCKRAAVELGDLERDFRLAFLEEFSLVSEAVRRAVSAQKLNLESHGNTCHHLHWTVFPRSSAQALPMRPVWESLPQDGEQWLAGRLDAEAHRPLRAAILEQLLSLGASPVRVFESSRPGGAESVVESVEVEAAPETPGRASSGE